jgi:hypothetical protein
MADHAKVSVDDAPVFASNSSETSEVACACCDKFKTPKDFSTTQISTKNH